MNIIFMGTPEFAIPCLNKLMNSEYKIKAIITQPDRQGGRGKRFRKPPVKIAGEEHKIPVFQPESINDEDFIEVLTSLEPDIIITVAFGQIIKKRVLNLPRLGCLNVHASLLPKYRGSAPIQWAIINGEEITGITIMYMNEGLDTGDIILKKEIAIGRDETAGQLYERLSMLGSEALIEALDIITDGKGQAIRQPQNNEDHTYYPMIDKSMGNINWCDSAVDIKNLIRGLTPLPGGYTFYKGKRLKLWLADLIEDDSAGEPGKIEQVSSKKGIIVFTRRGKIIIKELQFENSKRMNIEQYLRGNTIEEGSFFKQE